VPEAKREGVFPAGNPRPLGEGRRLGQGGGEVIEREKRKNAVIQCRKRRRGRAGSKGGGKA